MRRFLFAFVLFQLLLAQFVYAENFWSDFSQGYSFDGLELAYGPYDIMLAADMSFYEFSALSVKPNLRFDPFNIAFKFAVFTEYYPLTHFDTGWGPFQPSRLNPYALLGFQVPVNFESLSIPVGIGLQWKLSRSIYLGFRLYSDTLVVPSWYPSFTWDFSVEYKF